MVKCTLLPPLEKCSIAGLENGYFPLHSQRDFYKEGERVRYDCHGEYEAEHEAVTCTRDGWAPPPRCIRKSECAAALLRLLSKLFGVAVISENENSPSQNDLSVKDLTYYKSFLSDDKTETSNQDFHPFKWHMKHYVLTMYENKNILNWPHIKQFSKSFCRSCHPPSAVIFMHVV